MKVGIFTHQNMNPAFGILHQGHVLHGDALEAIAREIGVSEWLISLEAFLAGGIESLEAGRRAFHAGRARALPVDQMTFEAPFVAGRTIFAQIVNYAKHAEEASLQAPSRVFVFLKPNSSVVGPYAAIGGIDYTAELDFEGELAAVIGRPGRDIRAENALDHIGGYTVLNDVSARDLQFNRGAEDLTGRYGQNWTQGKGLDGFCPMGPVITTADEIPNPYPLMIETRVNGELRQRATTEDQLIRLPEVIASLSRGLTLRTGDVIATGTPEGCGIGDGRYLKRGDTVECSVDGLGSIRNVVA